MPWFRITSHIRHGNKQTSFVKVHQNEEEARKQWKSNQHVTFRVEAIDKPTLVEWWDFLNKHDWHYETSDDFDTVQGGRIADAILQTVLEELPQDYQDLHTGFCKWAYWIEGWGDRPSKPERPTDD
jgi:hypothetical protein